MNPKTLLITTVVGIATTAAFGAASVRAPQLGGGATTTPATTSTTARAGTLRAQTMKTSMSTSTATPTTTASISEPIAAETTDARLSFLKSVKGFNPGKVKDTSATQQELNNIDSRIEELQSKLDAAESAQATVLTESNIDAKIEEKLTELGASTSAKDTYSKTEINALLSALEKKLPQIDDRGNINIPTSNGQSQIQLLPYYLYATHTHAMLGHSMTYKLYTPHDFGTTNWQSLAQEYTSGWVNDICSEYQSNPDLLSCGFWVANGTSTAMTEFLVSRCDKGFYLFYTTNVGGVQTSKYATYENKTETQIREYFCGTLPNDLCWISNFQIKSSMGDCTPKIFYVNMSNSVPPYYLYHTQTNFGELFQNNFYRLTQPGSVSSVPETWITDICLPNQSNENVVGCGLWETHGNPMEEFSVSICYKGFYETSPAVPGTNGATEYHYMTFENLTESEARTRLCGGLPVESCWISSYANGTGNWGDSCAPTYITLQKIIPAEYWLSGISYDSLNPRTEHWYTYSGNPSNQLFNTWENEICQLYTNEFDCCMNSHSNGNFWIEILHNGYKLTNLTTTTNNGRMVLKQRISSYQYNDTQSLRAAVCGNASIDDCWVEEGIPGLGSTTICGHSAYLGHVYWAIIPSQSQSDI
ncbi:MAG: hypothetical protein J5714_00405 [Alphaproteobacteria bacterium]|nr:hypothetical protein [Alphaproteobacteria bacterium]